MQAVQPGCSAPCPLSLAVVLCSFGAVLRKSLYLAALRVKKHITEKNIEGVFLLLAWSLQQNQTPNLLSLTCRELCWVCRAEPCAVEVADAAPGGGLWNQIKCTEAVGKGAEWVLPACLSCGPRLGPFGPPSAEFEAVWMSLGKWGMGAESCTEPCSCRPSFLLATVRVQSQGNSCSHLSFRCWGFFASVSQ